jgi:hypothetical protein
MMLAGLQTHLGGFVADTLMEHLPPGGWHDVARTADFDRLRDEMIAMRQELRSELRSEISGVRTELREEISGVRTELREEISELRLELREEISGVRMELHSDIQALSDRLDSATRWIIGIALTSTISIMGTLIAVLITLLNQ